MVEEGSGTVELVPGGRDIQVNENNVYDYVRKYAEYRMIKTQEKALEVSARFAPILSKVANMTITVFLVSFVVCRLFVPACLTCCPILRSIS